MNSDLLFSLVIYSFLENLKENFYKDSYKFINDITNNILTFYDHVLKYLFLMKYKKKYINQSILLDYTEWELNLINNYTKQSNKKDFILDYKTILFENLKLNEMVIDRRNKLYKKAINDFNNDFNNEKNEIIKFEIERLSNIIYEFLLQDKNLNLFSKFQGKIGYKSYDHMYLVNFEIFNKINTTYYLLSKIPMICEPLK